MSPALVKSTSKIALLVIIGVAFAAPVNAQTGNLTPTFENTAPSSRASSFAAFKPKKRTDKRRLDYQIWDDVLQNIVIDFGASSRIRATRPQQGTGTRIVSGHTSPYRLEGSRIAFGFLNENYKNVLTEYRQDLVAIANQLDITRLSRDEQLAFWLNLHNVAVIEMIAQQYPEDVPSTMKIVSNGASTLLDDAKFINIRGQALSLKNIREDIVFANWTDPIVLYGFFRGDIGSPRMPRLAYTANNLEYRLNGNANEFVNSLRGFHKSRKARKVSAIYDEAKRFYFKNWSTDLAAHIKQYAESDALEDLATEKPFEIDRYETVIADLSGGHRRGLGLFLDNESSLPPETARLLSEVGRKQEILRKRGKLTRYNKGYVTIEDIEKDPNQDTGNTIK